MTKANRQEPHAGLLTAKVALAAPVKERTRRSADSAQLFDVHLRPGRAMAAARCIGGAAGLFGRRTRARRRPGRARASTWEAHSRPKIGELTLENVCCEGALLTRGGIAERKGR